MQSIAIVDGPNFFRRQFETSGRINPVRSCFNVIQYNKLGKDLVIVVWDGFHARKIRRDIFPDYKAKRVAPVDGFHDLQNMFKKVLELSNCIQVEVPGYEGDDVIAAIALKYQKHAKLFLETNDLDMAQLGLPMGRDKFPDKPQFIVLYKTMVGDPSDCIPGAKLFGEKAWQALTDENKQTLDHILTSGWGLHEEEVRALVEPFYPKRGLDWFVSKENRQLLQKFYRIVNFMPVEWATIEANMKAGANRPDLAEEIFKQYMY